jgi:hypothetical protein
MAVRLRQERLSKAADHPTLCGVRSLADRRSRSGFATIQLYPAASAASLTRVGQTDAARGLLEQALGSLDPSLVRVRLWWLPALARTYLADGEIEHACALAAEALTGATQAGVDTNVRMVLELQGDLAAHGDAPPVRRFMEQVHAVQLEYAFG